MGKQRIFTLLVKITRLDNSYKAHGSTSLMSYLIMHIRRFNEVV